jgi:ADP-ribose pyrophosphatase YjhB (NUDIX family)
MITNFNKYIKESLSNFDLSKLFTIVKIKMDNYGNLIYVTSKNRELILPKDKINKITIANNELISMVNSGKSITKYFELDGDTIIYAANFAVDAVCLNKGKIYLIDRTDGKGWALPGGFIDENETPINAVIRELEEETKCKRNNISKIEELEITKGYDYREINIYTYPFIVHIIDPDELKFADDAKNGKWVLLNRAIKYKLAFPHHNDILKKVIY